MKQTPNPKPGNRITPCAQRFLLAVCLGLFAFVFMLFVVAMLFTDIWQAKGVLALACLATIVLILDIQRG